MNKTRRKAIEKIVDKLMELQADLQWIKEDEDDARDAMPESLQDTERYSESEEASQAMEDADSSIQDAIDYLEGIE